MFQDVSALRRRGRWTQVPTLNRYLQEGVVYLSLDALPSGVSTRVRELARLAITFFRERFV
jgi:hypothetical protein